MKVSSMKENSMLDNLKKFYNGRKVYITGITGFKGTWLANTLFYLGAEVSGYGLRPEKQSLARIQKLTDFANVIYGDITSSRDQARFEKHIWESDPSVVFHLAAQPLVSEGYSNPYETYNTNIMGTVFIHEVLHEVQPCHRISMINVTTDKVYMEGDTPRNENDRLQGFDPYSLSKSCSDMISQSYVKSFPEDDVVISEMRAGNVLGGGDFGKDRIVTDYVSALQAKHDLFLRHPESTRPYQFVFDVIMAYAIQAMLQYNRPNLAGEYNVGPHLKQQAKTVAIANGLNARMENKVEINLNGASIGHENPALTLNVNKFTRNANWHPYANSIDKVLDEVAEWYNAYVNHESNENMATLTVAQIFKGLNHYDY